MEKLRTDQVPAILKVIRKEIILVEKSKQKDQNNGLKDSGVLKDFVKFLILYSSIVFTETDSEREKDFEINILENRNKPCMIDILPILVQISENYLMPNSSEY